MSRERVAIERTGAGQKLPPYRVVAWLAILGLGSAARANTIAYWRFEEGPANGFAGTVHDSSGDGLNGTAVNNPTFRTDVPVATVPATGAADHYSLGFDGSTQRIFVPDSAALALTHSMTIEAYVKIFGVPGAAGDIVFRGDDRDGLDPYVLNVQNGLARFVICNAANQLTILSAPVQYNQWVEIAGELDDATGKMSLYINGNLANSATATGRPFATLDPNSQPGVGIGNVQSPNYDQYFDGLIDEVRISDQALPPSALLDASPTPEPSRLTALAGVALIALRRRRQVPSPKGS